MELLKHIAEANAIEYIIALLGLFSFMGFWTFLTKPKLAPVLVRETERSHAKFAAGFMIHDEVFYHPGHAWVRVEGDNVVTVGLNDFASKLVGNIDGFTLPPERSELKQGSRGWTMKVGSKLIDMLSPVDGEVIAINHHAVSNPETVKNDPYGTGWLLKIKNPGITANIRNLIPPDMITDWLEKIRVKLNGMMLTPAMGTTMQDGGISVDGIAKIIEPENWEHLVEQFLLTGK